MLVGFEAAEGSPLNYIIKVIQYPDVNYGDPIQRKANQIDKSKVKESKIENLEANKKYRVGITAVYRVDETVVEGDPVESEFLLTGLILLMFNIPCRHFSSVRSAMIRKNTLFSSGLGF